MAKSRTQTPAPPTLTSDPSHPPLPAPHNFDILPPLHMLLSRLEPSLNTYTPDPTSASQPPDSTTSSVTGSSSLPGGGLNYKDAAVAASFLKTRIRRTLAELAKLEDMERTVEEQEVEIRELERKVRGQREMLARLGGEAGRVMASQEERGMGEMETG